VTDDGGKEGFGHPLLPYLDYSRMHTTSEPCPGGVLGTEPHQISTASNGVMFTQIPWPKKSDRSVDSDALEPTILVA